MEFFQFVLQHYIALGLLALSAYVFGARLLRSFAFDSPLEKFCFATTLGLGAISFLVFTLGLVHLLYLTVMLAVLLVGWLGCWPVWFNWPGVLVSQVRKFRPENHIDLLLTILGCLVIAYLFRRMLLLPLYPPTHFDATMYHLAYAKSYVQEHSLVYLPYLRVPVFPQTVEMLFTLALLFYDDLLAQMVELLMLFIVVVAMLAWARRWFSWRVGIWAVVFLLTSRVVIWLSGGAYIDLGMTAFTTLGFYAFQIWRQTASRPWLILAGVFCGFAVGTKYSALFFVLALSLAIVITLWQRAGLVDVAWFVGIAGVVAAPWYLRNLYYTGNPVFPFLYSIFGRIFGYGLWKPEYMRAEYIKDMDKAIRGGAPNGLGEFIRLPWNLAFNQSLLSAGSSPTVSEIYFRLFPLITFASLWLRRMRILFGVIIGFILFWFLSAPQSRYLMPILPVLSLMTAMSLDMIFKWLTSQWPDFYTELVGAVLTIVLCGLCLQTTRTDLNDKIISQGRPPITSVERDAYLEGFLPGYSLYKELNQKHGRFYKLYSLFQTNMAYYCDGVFMGDWFGPAAYVNVVKSAQKGESLLRELNALNAGYLLVDGNSRIPVSLPNDDIFKQHFLLVGQKGKIYLYQILP